MANITAIQELTDGARSLTIKLDIEGDGSGDEIAVPLVEAAAYGVPEVSLGWVKGYLNGFKLNLQWGGTTIAPLLELQPDNYIDLNWERTQRLTNPKVANYSGDVLMTTTGLESGERASLTFGFYKKRI